MRLLILLQRKIRKKQLIKQKLHFMDINIEIKCDYYYLLSTIENI